jgi:glycerol-3-phosphate dehydrogenase
MAELVTDFVTRRLEALDEVPRLRAQHSVTEHIQLAGGTIHGDSRSEAQRAGAEFSVDIATVMHLMATYGGNYRVVLGIASESDALKIKLIEGLPHIAAEALYAVRHEMAMTVEDLLARRTRIDLLARDHGRACVMVVERLLEREPGWTVSEKL